MAIQIENPRQWAIFAKLACLVGANAAKAQEDAEATQTKVAALATPLVDYMSEQKILVPEEVKRAGEMMLTHDGALQLLKFAAEKIAKLNVKLAQANATSLGGPEPNLPMTSLDAIRRLPGGVDSPFVGGKHAHLRESDMNFAKIMEDPKAA